MFRFPEHLEQIRPFCEQSPRPCLKNRQHQTCLKFKQPHRIPELPRVTSYGKLDTQKVLGYNVVMLVEQTNKTSETKLTVRQ